MTNQIHWPWNRRSLPRQREDDRTPAASLVQQEFNRMFEDFFSPTSASPPGFETNFTPRINVAESDTDLTVSAELPGLKESDIDLSLSRDSLTIKGEKKAEREEKHQGYHRIERTYGSFQRLIPLPVEIDVDRSEANFKNGILTVTLPKLHESSSGRKKITIKPA